MSFYTKHSSDNTNHTNPPLFLLHSGGMSSAEWQPQIQYLEKNFTVYTPDLLGHGNSLLDGELTIAKMAEATIAIMEIENIGKTHILGSSMGGAVALWIAINYPDLVDKLIVYRIGYKKNEETHQQTLNMANPNYWKKFGLHNWLSKLHEPQGSKNAWETVIGNVSKVMNPETSDHNHSLDDLASIKSETLLIAGDRDPLIPVEILLKMQQAIPNSGLWIMPYATHITSTNTWRAKSFADEVSRFLKNKVVIGSNSID